MADADIEAKIDNLTRELGRIPTVREAADRCGRNRTLVHAALRARRQAAEGKAKAVEERTVATPGDQVLAQQRDLKQLSTQVGELATAIEAARTTLHRQRRDLTNVRIALALIATEAQLREMDPTARRFVQQIQRAEFRPVRRPLPDGSQSPILDALTRATSIVAALADIEKTDGRPTFNSVQSMANRPLPKAS